MKLMFQILHTAVFYLIVAITFLLGTLIVFPVAFFSKRKYIPFQFAAKIWSRVLVILSGARMTVTGLENIPKSGPIIFVSNHQGAADITTLLAFIPRPFRFVIKKELFKMPFFGAYLRLSGYLSIDRKAAFTAHRTLGEANNVLEKGECILLFPEGTRSKTGEVGPFKRGSLMVALQSGATVIPIGISGSFNMMKKGSYLLNLVPMKLSFGKPIPFEKYKNKDFNKSDYIKELDSLRNTVIDLVN